MRIFVTAFFSLLFALQGVAQTFDFFKIQSAKYVGTLSSKGVDVFRKTFEQDDKGKMIFSPYVELSVRVGERTRFETMYAKIYYYTKERVLIDKTESPVPVARGAGNPLALPIFFEKNKTETLYFIVPEKVRQASGWRAVVVFGDKLAAAATVVPTGFFNQYDFPERLQVEKPQRIKREEVKDPVVEHVVKTGNPQQSQITLFMRPPIGMTDMSEADGVLAICLLANNTAEMKQRLQKADTADDVGGILRFAEKRKLVILCWGSRSLWDPSKNWDELDKAAAKTISDTFDTVSAAWARGVENLSLRYGIPNRGFLLWGTSGSAQYAQRLALRKPHYFLAVHLHIPSSFDKPTEDAAQVLWCLTTGENESGYERSLKFVRECRRLGYPILYKAIPGLGHQGHPVADRLGFAFFDYARDLRAEKHDHEATLVPSKMLLKSSQSDKLSLPWPASFREPKFIGDIINQQVLPAREAKDWVPDELQICIPTQELADVWGKEK